MKRLIMKTIIIEVDGIEMITVQLDREMADCISRVARSAHDLLSQDPVRRDAAACDPDFLALCKRGVTRLALLGARKEATLMIDATYLIDAHTAASLLASSCGLTKNERRDLLQVLGFLAATLPVWLMTGNLPPWKQIQGSGKNVGRVQHIYETLRERQPSDSGFRPIKMGDALVLREGLKLIVHPAILTLWDDLAQVTLTHRNALAHLMRRPA
jgi:hypothetical protein